MKRQVKKQVKQTLWLIAHEIINSADLTHKKERVESLEWLVDSMRQMFGEWVNDYFQGQLKKLRGVK